jgi:hypothetical protein
MARVVTGAGHPEVGPVNRGYIGTNTRDPYLVARNGIGMGSYWRRADRKSNYCLRWDS